MEEKNSKEELLEIQINNNKLLNKRNQALQKENVELQRSIIELQKEITKLKERGIRFIISKLLKKIKHK